MKYIIFLNNRKIDMYKIDIVFLLIDIVPNIIFFYILKNIK